MSVDVITPNSMDAEATAPISQISPEQEEVVFNYIIEIQRLVAQIFAELSRISSNDHHAMEKMKQKFMNATLTSAQLQSDYGRIGRNIGVAAFKRQEADGEASLELEKYRSKTAARQSEGNAKQDCTALLQSVAENQKSASRATG